jgi:23S rRNA (pseudouridine1915-N3)-methyltransferase
MQITILAVGKIRNGIFNQLYELYVKRLRWEIILYEIESHNKKSGEEQQKDESMRLITLIPSDACVITLDERGKLLSSRELASWVEQKIEEGTKDICLIIGGPNGLGPDILFKSNLILALGRATWPHLMVRGMIAEQIYRVQQILSGHPYHRD